MTASVVQPLAQHTTEDLSLLASSSRTYDLSEIFSTSHETLSLLHTLISPSDAVPRSSGAAASTTSLHRGRAVIVEPLDVWLHQVRQRCRLLRSVPPDHSSSLRISSLKLRCLHSGGGTTLTRRISGVGRSPDLIVSRRQGFTLDFISPTASQPRKHRDSRGPYSLTERCRSSFVRLRDTRDISRAASFPVTDRHMSSGWLRLWPRCEKM